MYAYVLRYLVNKANILKVKVTELKNRVAFPGAVLVQLRWKLWIYWTGTKVFRLATTLYLL